jgi:hypothetical protein
MTLTQVRRRPLQALAFLGTQFWSAKRLAILIGFGLTALGTLGPQFYVSSIEDSSAESDQFAKSLTARIDTLRAAQSQYLLFEQMGVLVYALNASGLAACRLVAARHVEQPLSTRPARPLDLDAPDDR